MPSAIALVLGGLKLCGQVHLHAALTLCSCGLTMQPRHGLAPGLQQTKPAEPVSAGVGFERVCKIALICASSSELFWLSGLQELRETA